jgi:catechol 2,3-dioxygenase-like lactoylglutathione lyase family enzyme
MVTRLVHLAMDANDPAALARFWASGLGWEIAAEEPGEVDVWPSGYKYPDPAALPLVFVRVPEPHTVKNRVHLDLATTSAEHQRELTARLRGLGATPADVGQGEVPWEVLADPEGNEFCVLEPRAIYSGTGPIAAVVIDCRDPGALATFWTAAAGWPVQHADDEYASLRAPSGTGPFLELLRVPGAKTVKNRVHPDVAPCTGGNVADEAQRLLELGATPADIGQGEVSWEVLADPEGNELCILSPR